MIGRLHATHDKHHKRESHAFGGIRVLHLQPSHTAGSAQMSPSVYYPILNSFGIFRAYRTACSAEDGSNCSKFRQETT
jgi:hypothetical protein